MRVSLVWLQLESFPKMWSQSDKYRHRAVHGQCLEEGTEMYSGSLCQSSPD